MNMKKLIISMKTMLCYRKYFLRMMAVLCLALGVPFAQGTAKAQEIIDGETPRATADYTINSTANWNTFCNNVNSGTSYSGQTVTLNADIVVSSSNSDKMAGNGSYAFKGIFDGNGHKITFNYTNTSTDWCAPFSHIEGATIKNLKVEGTLTASYDRVGGLVGDCYGSNTIENCVSNITINSSVSGDGTIGGFVSRIQGGTTTFKGCIFTGKLLGSSTNSSGGFVGWLETDNSSKAVLNNCIYKPAQRTMGTSSSYTFVRGRSTSSSYLTFKNCYYSEMYGTSQGKVLQYTITGASGVSVDLGGTTTSYNLSTITGSDTDNRGIKYNGTIYGVSGDNVLLTLTASGLSNPQFSADHGSLSGSSNLYTLAMTNNNTIISAIASYTITATANPSAGGSVTGGGQYLSGTSITVSASSNSGYCFLNWTENGSEVSTNPFYNFTVSGDRTLEANFVAMNASSISVSGTTVTCGSSATLTASGLTGVTYNWYSDAACTQLIGTGATLTTPMLFDNTTYYVKAEGGNSLVEGTPTTYSSSGSYTYSVPSGTPAVKLEVWGAEGGGQRTSGNTDSGYGGKGGYSVGTFPSTSGTLYVCVGGAGSSSTSGSASGGYNGGGSGCASSSSEPGNGGGGATHIAKSSGLLTSFSSNYSTQLLIVAGGGGGGGEDGSDKGGAGGGTSGENGQNSGSSQSDCAGGSQTSAGPNAGFGYGASTGSGDGGGGGGGFYGGGSKTNTSSGTDTYGGGGGSGYLNTALAESQTIAGNASMPDPNAPNSTMTGREGDGYARITPYVLGHCETDAKAVTVTVNPISASDITVGGNSTSCGNSATLTASGLSGVTYKWYSDAACTILVATGSTFTTPVLNNTTIYYVKAVKEFNVAGTPTPFEYHDYEQTYSIPTGASSVKLEVWGAQGGNTDTRRTGGKGGYSYGRLSTPNGGTLYVCVGGQGTSDDGSFSSSTLLPGGWNGGGAGRAWGTVTHGGGGGGGATHIAKAAPSSGSDYQLRYYSSNQSDVLIVAGGGGGSSDNGNGGAGGGTSGIAGSGTGGCSPGTQSSGSAWGYATDCTYTGGECGGGGGGYYGGYSATAENYAGGGGSGYLNLSLTDAETIDGDNTMTNPSGGTMTGREGNGYARITPYYQGVCESEPVAVTITVNCTSTMTYDANGGSGTMTDPNSPYNYGSTVTVLANSFTRTGYVFNCWNTAADGSGTKYVAGDTFTITANTTLYAQWAPLVIANTTQWNEFAAAVNSGFSYSGQTVYLDEDITNAVTEMAGDGTGTNCFQGTFDGQCHTIKVAINASQEKAALFPVSQNATFQNLRIEGSIQSGYVRSGSLVGYTLQSCTVINCISAVAISSTYSGEVKNGGFIGETDSWSHLTMEGCAFVGSFNGSNAFGWGGLVGFNYGRFGAWMADGQGATTTITNCVFAPTSVNVKNSSSNPCATFSYGWKDHDYSGITVTNSYYNVVGANMYKKQGTQCYTITPGSNTTVALTGTTTDHNYAASCSGTGLVFYDNEDSNSTFDNGFSYNNGSTTTLYAAGNVTANLLLGATTPANSTFFYYSATPGSLSGNAATGTNDPYTLTMTAANQTITANYVNQTTSTDWTTAVSSMPSSGISIGNPTNISNANGLAWFISLVNGLNGQDGNDFSSYIINLTADVDMSAHTWVPIGTVEHPFSGTFNGNGHVIKGVTRSTDFPHDGLFGYVSGSANIQNVVVQASLTGNSHATGAVVGTFASTGTISNVEGAGTLTSGALTTALGGVAGNNSGTIHSSFAVATMTGGASATQMGGLVGNNTGNLYNSYSNATYVGTSVPKGGLVGSNSGTVENCYAAGIASGVSAFAGSNSGSGTIQYCYTDAVGSGYIGINGTAPTGSGTYGEVLSSTKHLNYMYRDNLITKNTNSYVGTKDAIADGIDVYVDKHIPVWNGLVSALNQWVRSNPRSLTGLAPWYRPLTTHINGDLPVLGFAKDNSLGTLDSDGKFLQYGSNQNGGNGLDAVLTTFNNSTASIFHYGKATGVANVPTSNVKVSIAEDAVLLQATSASPFTATVGVTFDNSDHGQHAYDYWGNKLNYDWHLLSTPLNGLKTGAVHSSSYTEGTLPDSQVDITDIRGYFPDGLITSDNPAVGGTIKWDFYTYYEPEYHWINLKRSKNNHIHQDGGAPIHYDQNDQDTDGKSAYYISGKGYEMAINQDTYMNATGTLNRGNVPIMLSNSEPDDINYAKGWNLVGNPYQAYLDLEAVNKLPAYIYDADQGTFVPYTQSASENPVTPSQYIHPHQAFFVLASGNNEELIFTQSMATTEVGAYSHFRDKVNYPLVNLFAEDGAGHRDLTVIEFHRPELGGAPKLDYMRTSPFSLAAYYSGRSYGILFATDDIERVPVHFRPGNGGLITLTWSTHNGEFSMLNLIDNKLGVEHNMLADNTYVFEASPDDYSSRFYITYECSGTGIDENDDDGASTGSATFAYINNGNIVIDVGSGHGASLQMIDVLGRVMYSTVCTDDVHTVSTNGLAKGVYLIRLVNNKMVRTQKIVVK